MSRAWISARAGCAVVEATDGVYRLEAEAAMPPEPCTREQLANLFTMAPDVTSVEEAGAFPFQDVQSRLDGLWRRDRALTTVLMTTDGDLSAEVRAEAAQVAAHLLADTAVRESVRNRLLAAPLPKRAVGRLQSVPPGPLRDLLAEAASHRTTIARLTEAWKRAAFRTAR